MREIIARRIKEIRSESGLKQEEFGKRLNVSQDTVSMWEKGKRVPTTEFIIAICREFKVSADYLLGLRDY